jgi:ABC-type sugar transport system ATPase subunit
MFAQALLGYDPRDPFSAKPRAPGKLVRRHDGMKDLRVGVPRRYLNEDVDRETGAAFTFYGGQVTGIFGLVGSGRTETARIIANAIRMDFFGGSEIRLNGRSVRYRVPREAVKDGIIS